jgi:hypothetical protein
MASPVKFIIPLIQKTIFNLQKLLYKIEKPQSSELNYTSLSPIIIEQEKSRHYMDALSWAIDNKSTNDIRNIALTGPYGSGKSSILKTFKTINRGRRDLKFLNISLATFKEEKLTSPPLDGGTGGTQNKEQLKQIEISILEQIFYHEKDENVPDSRFKKIKHFSKWEKIVLSSFFIVFVLSASFIFVPDWIGKLIFKDNIQLLKTLSFLKIWVHYFSVLILFIFLCYFVYKSVRIFSAITLSKLSIQNAEIGFGEAITKSVLNHHIDELLYFFKVTKYNIVVIEDLDRFYQTEIFTKLREINLILNSSEITKSLEIVFIYAVRDEIFTSKDRTKFFDFIVPVIPVINSSNSREILVTKRTEYAYKLSDPFIEDISFFIDDMRLLNNTLNEFFLYKHNLSDGLTHERLFAIITYKNIFPEDFSKLGSSEDFNCTLVKKIEGKTMLIKQQIFSIDEAISRANTEIERLGSLILVSVKELRYLYILKAVENVPHFNHFLDTKSSILPFDQVANDEFFFLLKQNELKINSGGNSRFLREFKQFRVIENSVDPQKSYIEREQEIIDFNSNKVGRLREMIKQLENDKVNRRNAKLYELIRTDPTLLDLSVNNSLEIFLNIVLRNAYITEDYMDYISLFHEGSITKSDHKYLISVKNGTKLDPAYNLFKIETVINRINLLDFKSTCVLNNDLLDFLLKNEGTYDEHVKYIYEKLKDESAESKGFIDGYIDISKEQNNFVKLLCSRWVGYWAYVSSHSVLTEQKKLEYLRNIINHGNIDDIEKMANSSDMREVILSHIDKLVLLGTLDSQLKEVIMQLNLRFNKIGFDSGVSSEILEYIYKNNHYQINTDMLYGFMKKFEDVNDNEFYCQNYHSLASAYCKTYVDVQINEYVENVYLKIGTNIIETESAYISLLNQSVLNIGNTKALIGQVNTLISNLSSIEKSNVRDLLLLENKVLATWDNLLLQYDSLDDGILSVAFVKFISIPQNAEQLAQISIEELEKKESVSKLINAILCNNQIADDSYNTLLSVSSWESNDLPLGKLSHSKIRALIDKKQLGSPLSYFDTLEGDNQDLRIYLLEKNKSIFIDNLGEEPLLTPKDIQQVLKSDKFSMKEKGLVVEAFSFTNNEILSLILDLLISHIDFSLSNERMQNICLTKSLESNKRIDLFCSKIMNITPDIIERFLGSLGKPYTDIIDKEENVELRETPQNESLLRVLKKENYISKLNKKKGKLVITY